MTNVTYDQRITHYDSPDGMDMLQRIANERGLSATAALRQLVREEIKRLNREAGGAE
jgi:hypothetical protein